ncbi:MAG: transposase, partial [Clostridia bacterium]|nr:transposase [Clostridia bacterium]
PAGAVVCLATVERTRRGKYYVSITYSFEKDVPAKPYDPALAIGLDYKSDGLFAASDGSFACMPKFFKESQDKLAKRQRKLKHKVLGSNNYRKEQDKIYKLRRHSANQRKDFLHKLSTQIANEYSLVCAEDLDIKAISNKGFKNGKATLDNGWGMFTQMLSYKLAERGGKLVKVDKFYPSTQLCSVCHSRRKLALSERIYKCPVCGNVADRDINAARNILAEGIRIFTS